jgi:hypothetical protein
LTASGSRSVKSRRLIHEEHEEHEEKQYETEVHALRSQPPTSGDPGSIQPDVAAASPNYWLLLSFVFFVVQPFDPTVGTLAALQRAAPLATIAS